MAGRMAERFRGFLPVIVDVETGGFDAERDALLEIAAVVLRMTPEGYLQPLPAVSAHVRSLPRRQYRSPRTGDHRHRS